MVAFGSWKKNNPFEFFPTPSWVTKALLAKESFAGITWEPACGDGAISRLLPGDVLATDLVDYGYDLGMAGVDFLQTRLMVDNVVTNPPYSKKIEFILHGLECARAKVALLLETRVINEKWYRPLFVKLPPRSIYALSGRLCFGKAHAMLWGHAWFVWEVGFQGKTTIEVL